MISTRIRGKTTDTELAPKPVRPLAVQVEAPAKAGKGPSKASKERDPSPRRLRSKGPPAVKRSLSKPAGLVADLK